MSKQSIRKPLALVLGAAVVSTMGVAGIANADEGEDLFAMEELMSGQLTAGGHLEGGCGDDRDKSGDDDGEGEGEGSCGDDKKDGEGSCGEGKCGG